MLARGDRGRPCAPHHSRGGGGPCGQRAHGKAPGGTRPAALRPCRQPSTLLACDPCSVGRERRQVMRPPKGMFWREGRGYYCRVYQGGKERWVALGKEFDVALEKFKETRFQSERDERVLVHDLIERWLKVYIATARNEKGQVLAK